MIYTYMSVGGHMNKQDGLSVTAGNNDMFAGKLWSGSIILSCREPKWRRNSEVMACLWLADCPAFHNLPLGDHINIGSACSDLLMWLWCRTAAVSDRRKNTLGTLHVIIQGNITDCVQDSSLIIKLLMNKACRLNKISECVLNTI